MTIEVITILVHKRYRSFPAFPNLYCSLSSLVSPWPADCRYFLRFVFDLPRFPSLLSGRDRERDIQKARMGFLEMEPIFGQLKAEWSAPHTNPLRPFLLHVHGLPTDPPALRFHVTDFHSKTWEALKTEQDLEDMVPP